MVGVVGLDELFEVGEFLGGEDERFGVEAGFEGVHGGGGLACDRGGAGGFLGVATVGFYLTRGGHGGSRMDRPGVLSYFYDRGMNLGVRGWMAVSDWKQGANIVGVWVTAWVGRRGCGRRPGGASSFE